MMRLNSTPNALNILLRECYARPHRQCCSQKRPFIISAAQQALKHEVKEVAVIGGGITGLATAYYISKLPKKPHVTLYESGPRLGGWLRSTSIDIGNGNVVFEQGPRNLRPSVPNGLLTLRLVDELGLLEDVLMTSKESVAAQNRFVYYPDHLVCMPGPGRSLLENLSTVFSEPAFNGLMSGILLEPFRSNAPNAYDESVGSFVSRCFGSAIADNIVSAVFHGIYAGDIYQLSARSILTRVHKISQSYDSLIIGYLSESMREDPLVTSIDQILMEGGTFEAPGSELFEKIRRSSVFTFKRGIGQLAETLEKVLIENPRVTILKNTPINALEMITEGNTSRIQIKPLKAKGASSRAGNRRYSHVVSTISGKTLNAIAKPANCLSPLALTPSVTIMVVNLYYSSAKVLPVHGFGYLLPRSVPLDQNPERALGVVFDSDATIGQDEVPGTKLTVMMGGHWWDGWDTYPDEDQGAFMAKSVLARHLGITDEPQMVRVALQKECIPQYTVGHAARLRKAHQCLLDSFQGRLKVAGNSYTGVGLNDCVRAAQTIGHSFLDRFEHTGLDDLVPGHELWTRHAKDTKKDPPGN